MQNATQVLSTLPNQAQRDPESVEQEAESLFAEARRSLDSASQWLGKSKEAESRERGHRVSAAISIRKLISIGFKQKAICGRLSLSKKALRTYANLAEQWSLLSEETRDELLKSNQILSLNQAEEIAKTGLEGDDLRRLIEKVAREDLPPKAIPEVARTKNADANAKKSLREQLGISDQDVSSARLASPEPPAYEVEIQTDRIVVRLPIEPTVVTVFAALTQDPEKFQAVNDALAKGMPIATIHGSNEIPQTEDLQ